MKFIILTLLSFNISYAEVVITHSDLTRMVKEQGYQSQINNYNLEADQERLGHLKRSFLPQVEIYAAGEHFKKGLEKSKTEPEYGATISVNLFNAQRDQLKDEALQIGYKKTKAQNELLERQELVKANELFWNAVYLQDMITLIQNLEKQQNQNLSSIKRRIDSGLATSTDKIDFEISEIERQNDLKNSKLTLDNTLSQLKVVLGLEDSSIKLKEKLNHEHQWEEKLSINQESANLYLEPQKLSIQETALNAKSNDRFWWPKLDVYAGFNQFNQREEEYSNRKEREEAIIGIKLSMNIFDGFNSKQESKALSHQVRAQEVGERALRRQWETLLEIEFNELRKIHSYYHISEEKIKKTESFYKSVHDEYSRGVRNSSDIVSATQRLFDAKKEQLEILRDFQILKNRIATLTKY